MGFGSVLFRIVGFIFRFIFVNLYLLTKGKQPKTIEELNNTDENGEQSNITVGGAIVFGFIIIFLLIKS